MPFGLCRCPLYQDPLKDPFNVYGAGRLTGYLMGFGGVAVQEGE